jgi:hypothetical protein
MLDGDESNECGSSLSEQAALVDDVSRDLLQQ